MAFGVAGHALKLGVLVVGAAAVFAPPALAGNGTFAEAPPVASSSPSYVAVGDFNSDGDEDLAVVNSFDADKLAIRVGAAGATFFGALDVTDGTDPRSVAIGDWNIDGDEDLALSNVNGGIVPVRTGSSGAGFTDAPNIAAGNTADIGIGDFDGDGEEDLAIIDIAISVVRIRTGASLATFNSPADVALAAQPRAISVGDFNNDGDPDLAVLETSQLEIFTGTNVANTATFTAAPTVPLPGDRRAMGMGDFNSDGDLDLAIANFQGGAISIRTGAAGATFEAAPDLAGGVPATVGQMAVGDFNSDGDQDLAATGLPGGGAFIHLGAEGATFTLGTSVPARGNGQPAVGDFDQDGNQDLAIPGGGAVTIRTGAGPSLLSGNLLANGGAEEGIGDSTGFGSPEIPSWTRAGTMTFLRYSTFGFFPRRPEAQGWEGGEEFFSGGPTAGESSATQTASVPLAPASVDAGLGSATLSADLGGYRLDNDRMQVTAEFLDGASAVIGTFTIGPVGAADRGNLTTLVRRAATQPMPAGTRAIRVTLTALDASGIYNSAYADNVKLTVAAADADADGIGDGTDNCPADANSDQADNDHDSQGDVCDPDDDNDTVLDATDVCALLPGAAANGCPRRARTLSLRYARRAGKFRGRLRPRDSCAAGERVRIFRAKRGPDKRIGRARTKLSGSFQLAKRVRSGRFYARAGARTIPNFGNCTKARSKRVTVG